MPRLRSVDSTSIAAVGYDAATRDLYIRFHESEALYAYHGVDPATYAELLASESKGRYVNREIKPRFDYTRLE
jgi:hypothetical protein